MRLRVLRIQVETEPDPAPPGRVKVIPVGPAVDDLALSDVSDHAPTDVMSPHIDNPDGLTRSEFHVCLRILEGRMPLGWAETRHST